jgi:hypothetical protein
MDQVQIQVQDDSGNWRTYVITNNIPAQIRTEMRLLKSQFPDNRVRAVTMDDRFVDMLP